MKNPVSTIIAVAAGLILLAIFGGRGPEAPEAPEKSSPAQAQTKLVDINRASPSELIALKGIGSKRAEAIIQGRPYASKDELLDKNILPRSVYLEVKDQIIAKQK